ncbi:MAG TPA: L-threonylcarbamoyladenylate synthase [Solirubrobacteraceae bacterium]|jgi:L-threonylcarbamoyladenylate synthase|nr:L-threonylcarbamoyladenylate synthase [Solirubrobacteraceae bacterium]
MSAKTGEQQQLSQQDAMRLRDCVAGGGVAVLPTDTVYGVCCDPDDEQAARRLYALKGRPAARPAAVMFFALEPALELLGDLHPDESAALQALLPGPVTALLANPAARFAPACRTDPATLGLRVPRLPESLAALGELTLGVMQTSANISGEPDARTLGQIPASLREGADCVLDGGELPGTPSTVVDLRDYAEHRRWHVLREGAMAREAVRAALTSLD